MNFDPQKFFIGLMDFFSILLPGALLTYLLKDEFGPVVLGNHYHVLSGAEAWAAFLFASYLFGHLTFLLGAMLDGPYDWFRSRTLNKQITTLARYGRLLPWIVRVLIWLIFKTEQDRAVKRVVEIKAHLLGPLQAENSINAFQWCKAYLTAEKPASMAAVQRLEADSKFFRSFTVVLIVLLFAWSPSNGWCPTYLGIAIALLLLALWRYMEQRFKATNQAYWSIITLMAKDGKVTPDKNKSDPAMRGPSRAGGVVYRMRWGRPQYLLVQSKENPEQWVLPKGHVEEKEHPRETAVREVQEETGVWASIQHDLGDVSYSVNGATITVKFYLMRAVGRGLRKDKHRRRVWLALPDAVKRASYAETRSLLNAAEQQRMKS